jgi:hypothetical protein
MQQLCAGRCGLGRHGRHGIKGDCCARLARHIIYMSQTLRTCLCRPAPTRTGFCMEVPTKCFFSAAVYCTTSNKIGRHGRHGWYKQRFPWCSSVPTRSKDIGTVGTAPKHPWKRRARPRIGVFARLRVRALGGGPRSTMSRRYGRGARAASFGPPRHGSSPARRLMRGRRAPCVPSYKKVDFKVGFVDI